jgi:hypothetical protein
MSKLSAASFDRTEVDEDDLVLPMGDNFAERLPSAQRP